MKVAKPDSEPIAEIPNDQIAATGHGFRKAADLLYSRMPEMDVSPLLVVASFGIELLLKSLNAECVYHQEDDEAALGVYRVTAKPIKFGHNLVELLDAIDDRFRKGLEDAYLASPVVRGKGTLREAVEGYKKHFENARYPFEDGTDYGSSSITGLVGRQARIVGSKQWKSCQYGSLATRQIDPGGLLVKLLDFMDDYVSALEVQSFV